MILPPEAEIEKKRTLERVAATFEANVREIVASLAAAAEELETTRRCLSSHRFLAEIRAA